LSGEILALQAPGKFPENSELPAQFFEFPSIFNASWWRVDTELPSRSNDLPAKFPVVCGTGNLNRRNREIIPENREPVAPSPSSPSALPSPQGRGDKKKARRQMRWPAAAPKAVAKRNGEILVMTTSPAIFLRGRTQPA
jgi:hypothetical protein